MKTVMIVAGESSGDLYGSLLAKALKGIWQDVRLIGIGGQRMSGAGVELLSGISSALGITEVLPSIKKIRESFMAAKRALIETPPDVVVLIDYPDFNFRLGKAAKRYGIKVLYYVSPQVWAWRRGRVGIMAGFVDKVAVILPFEEEIYRRAGIPCEFVGHPVMEEIEQYEVSSQQSAASSQKEKSKIQNPVISLLPGSRINELNMLLPVFIDVVRLLKDELGECKFILPIAPNIETERFKPYFNSLESEGVMLVKDGVIKSLISSDMAVIASGTATLQAALLGIPMVVVYKLSPLSYFLGKAILNVKNISLVNILSGEEVVSELIQHMAKARNIVEELKRILYDLNYRGNMVSSFRKIRGCFSGKRPSCRVAEMIGEMTGWTSERSGDVLECNR